jgi:hypothetical protein
MVGSLGEVRLGLHDRSAAAHHICSSRESRFQLQDSNPLSSLSIPAPFVSELGYGSSTGFAVKSKDGARPRYSPCNCGPWLNAVKDLHSYYVLWKGRDKDVEEIRRQLTWIMNVFQSIEATLQHDNLNSTQKQMICDSIEACQGIMTSSKEN